MDSRILASIWRILLIAGLCCFSASAWADEAITYKYDELGRLVVISTTGSANAGQEVSTSFDPAGNRTNYAVNGVAQKTLAIGNASVTEGGTLAFTVTRSGYLAGPVSVAYATSNGTASADSDYTPASGRVTFATGQTTATINVSTTDDSATEVAETLLVTLSAPSANTTITAAVGTGTINDNDLPSASLAVSNASVTEGGALQFTVTRSGNTATAVSASYATADGTAVAGSDYTAGSGTVNFAADQTTATISVMTTDDADVEPAETLTVTLSAPSANAAITTATGTGTITDNDVATASLAIGNASVTEGGTLAFTVTRSGNLTIAASANYASGGGTATEVSDYTAASGTVSFAANQTTATITVTTIDDTEVESAETLTMTLSSPSANTTIAAATGIGTINDNDVAPAILSMSNASATEGGTIVLTVNRSGNTAIAASASYYTAEGTATEGSDYTPVTGTVSFAPNQTSATISVPTIDDNLVEPSETVKVFISSPSANTTINIMKGLGTINDNDIALAIGNASATEGSPLTFTVTRTGSTTVAAAASYTTGDGTALAGSDFTATALGTVTFAANQTTATITVPTIDDAASEPTETMTVTLTATSANTTVTTATGTGTINDNDVAPANLAIGNASVTEGGTLVFTVTRSGNTAIAASAGYATSNGTAGTYDYTAASGTVSFAANQTTATISVATLDDTTYEPAETMKVTLSAPGPNTAITAAVGSGTINDNDVTFTISGSSVTEGGALVFTVIRVGSTTNAIGASYTTQNWDATAGIDYIAKSGTVILAAGQTTATITVTTIDDSIEEQTEAMGMALSNPTGGATFEGEITTNGTIVDNDPHTNTILTDGDFNVLEQHQGTYRCGYSANLAFSVCVLVQSSIKVYDESLPNPSDPYYSITTGQRLQVETPYYGTGVAP